MSSSPVPPRGSWVGAVLTSLVVTLLCVLAFAAVGEVYFRLTRPFLNSTYPVEHVPGVGFLYRPGAEVQQTNELDYWVRQPANAEGFLADLPKDPAPGSCRIALIGDSFVSAIEVAREDKLQQRLTRLGAAHVPPVPLSVWAYGYGGTGQLNQLPYYDRYARAHAPQVIVLVFVGNDFANNSAALEAIRGGFDPQHPPRTFARRAPDGSYTLLPPDDAGWQSHLLRLPQQPQSFVTRANVWLRTHSYFYAWIFAKLAGVAPHVAARLSGTPLSDIFTERGRIVAAMPGFGTVLDGWDPARTRSPNPTLLSMDAPFAWPTLPPVFAEAVGFTGFALDSFQERARRDGAKLLILATDNLRLGDPDGLRFQRLKTLADARGIPVIDMATYMRSQGDDEKDATFANDGHWTPTGHQWAAQALFAYLLAHPGTCTPGR